MINKYIIALPVWNEHYDNVEYLLKSFADYKQVFENIYIVKTHQDSEYIFKKFKQVIGNCEILIIDYDCVIGTLNTSIWNWLKYN